MIWENSIKLCVQFVDMLIYTFNNLFLNLDKVVILNFKTEKINISHF